MDVSESGDVSANRICIAWAHYSHKPEFSTLFVAGFGNLVFLSRLLLCILRDRTLYRPGFQILRPHCCVQIFCEQNDPLIAQVPKGGSQAFAIGNGSGCDCCFQSVLGYRKYAAYPKEDSNSAEGIVNKLVCSECRSGFEGEKVDAGGNQRN
ncbi:MAG: hypothetical protein JWM99_2236 [Verrucomicrobiales bacterium]|nr:hypothetical protein [Verrucomicrobiales bacterium]